MACDRSQDLQEWRDLMGIESIRSPGDGLSIAAYFPGFLASGRGEFAEDVRRTCGPLNPGMIARHDSSDR